MLDVHSLIGGSLRYNLHGHTQFCDGRAPMQDFINEALAQGFTHYGFTPHAPTRVDSPCNMRFEQMEAFLAELYRLRALHGEQICILGGLEIDYIDGFGPSDNYFQSLPLDYRIGSVHFIPSLCDASVMVDIDGRYERFKEKMRKYFDNDIEWVVHTYYSRMMTMIENGGFDIVGHLDKIGFNAGLFRPGIDREPWYDALVHNLVDSIKDHHYIVEVNTKVWTQHGRLFPDVRYFSLLKRYQIPIVFNSDAHHPHLINAGRFEAMERFVKA